MSCCESTLVWAFEWKHLRMNIIAIKTLRDFWKEHPRAERPLHVLYNRLRAQDWNGPQEIKDAFGGTVSFVEDNRVISDISGNKFRVIVAFAYPYKRGLIKFVGTHAQYDKIRAGSHNDEYQTDQNRTGL